MEQELARKSVIIVLIFQLVYHVSIVFLMAELWTIGELPEYLLSSVIHFALPVFTLVPFGLLLWGSKEEHVKYWLYASALYDFGEVIGHLVMHYAFGGDLLLTLYISFLLFPGVLILYFAQSMEFVPRNYEPGYFEIFRYEMQDYTDPEEGLDHIKGFIDEGDFADGLFTRFLEYMSNWDDEMGRAARARLRADIIAESVQDVE